MRYGATSWKPAAQFAEGLEYSAASMVPRDSAFSSVRWSAFSSVLTKKEPMMEQMMPPAAMTMGIAMALNA